MVPPALLSYDFALVMADEVNLVWSRKLNIASVIYGMNRVASVLSVVWIILDRVDGVRVI